MAAEIVPEPGPDEERAILAALDETAGQPAAYRSRWRAAALEDLGGYAPAEDSRSPAGIVEP